MHGHRSLSVDLKEFDPEIERTLKALRAQGKISNTCEIKMAENPRALREYFTPNTYNSPIGLDERNHQMVDSSCGGTFLHKTADENLCRNKSMQPKDFTDRMTHIQTRTIQAGEIILISPGGNKEGKFN
ncbi:hypothetical protein M9H77_25783 [Catharanthus roseus]|uniref:Uncharacterized protein n=1 Tax=Catharanthus roseus TaxID=4058 RepID=A0ACC0A9P4_CATRO|nr:hypothetical protein M9H77_25783 [Catharanthus roseus]